MPSTTSRPNPRRSTPASAPTDLSFAEHVCLELIIQGVSHGWALGTVLGPDGELGRIWTLNRPLTYRAIDGLVDKALVTRAGQVSGQTRARVVLEATPAGRRVAQQWLDTPIQHLRDVRTGLLVKLALRDRGGLDNELFLAAQQQLFEPTIDVLTSTHGDDLVALWRRESARAVRRFLVQALHPIQLPSVARPEMRLSARNQLHATITAVHHGEVMSTVKAVLGNDSQPLTAAITKDAAEDLDLAAGDAIVLIVKSTEVMVAKALQVV